MAKQQRKDRKSTEGAEEILLRALKRGWETYHRQATMAVAVGAVIILVVFFYSRSRKVEANEGWKVVAEVYYMQVDAAEARRKCETYLRSYGSSAPGAWIKLRLAQLQLEAGEAAEALKTLREMEVEYKGEPVVEVLKPLLAAALEANKLYAEAAKTYEKLAGEARPPLAARYWLNAGRNREAASAAANARGDTGSAEQELALARKDFETVSRSEPSPAVQSLADYYSMLLAKGHRRTMPERPPVKEPLGSEGMPAQMPEGP